MLRRSLGVCAVVLLLASAVSAQPQGGQGGPGGRGGMFGQGFNPGAMPGAGLMYLANPAVQKELAITDEQKTKVTELQQKTMEELRSSFGDFGRIRDMSDDERTKFFEDARKKAEESGKKVEEKMGKILDAKQMERLKQIQLQMQGVMALISPDVVAKLKLSKDSQDKIQKIIDDSRKQRPPRINYFNASDEERKAFMDKMQKQREDNMKSALAVLDDDQLEQWGKMTGKEFKGAQGGMFGLGGAGNFFGGGRGGPNNQGGNRTPPPNNGN